MIRKVSKKRAKQLSQYNKRVKAWKHENSICLVGVKGCTRFTDDCHHMAGKENERLLDETLWLPVCRNCHTYITENSKEAIENGWSVSRIAKVSVSPNTDNKL